MTPGLAGSCALPSGLRLAYSEWPGAGPTMVLLHGVSSNRRIWDLVAPRLAERFRVLAVDQRGHGESDKPANGYDFASVTTDLEQLLAALGVERAVLVGHSWGASVALHYAVQRPEAVAGLALVDGGVGDFQAAGIPWEQVEPMLTPPRLAGTPLPELLARIRSGPLGGLWSPQVEAIVLANFEVGEQGHVSPRLPFECHMQVVRALWEQRPTALFPRLACPTLAALARRPPTNERDVTMLERKQAGVAAIQRLNPHVTIRWFDDTIHDIPLQRPKELASLLAGDEWRGEGEAARPPESR